MKSPLSFLRNHWRDLLTIFLLVLASLILIESTDSSFFRLDQQSDPNVYQYVARVIDSGGVPYRDTFDHKGPVVYLINYLGLLLGRTHGIWLVQFILIFATILLIYLTARKVLKTSPSLAFLLSFLCLSLLLSFADGTFNITETYLIPLIAGSAYIFLDYFLNEKLSTIRLILCGAMLGLAIMIKPNYAAIWGALSLGVFYKLIKQKDYRELFHLILLGCAGIAITTIPLLLWIIIGGAWNDFINQFITFNFAYTSDPQWANPVSKITAFFFLASNIFILSALILSTFLLFSKKILKNHQHLALATFTLALLTTLFITAISGQSYRHYGYTFAPLIFLPFAFILPKVTDYKQSALILLALIPIISTAAFSPWSTAIISATTNFHHRDQSPLSPSTAKVVNIINNTTSSDDRISVVGNWDFLYNHTNRFSASKYSYQYPIAMIDQKISTEFFNDLDRTSPKLIISHLPDNSSELSFRLSDFINNHKYAQIYSSDDGIKVYRKEY